MPPHSDFPIGKDWAACKIYCFFFLCPKSFSRGTTNVEQWDDCRYSTKWAIVHFKAYIEGVDYSPGADPAYRVQ